MYKETLPLQAPGTDDAIRHFSDGLDVEGVLPHGRRFGRQELLALADAQGGPATVECFSGRHIRRTGPLRGVRLTTLLDLAGMQALPRSQCKQLVIAAIAGDGYACLFTWHELYNSPLGAGVLAVVEDDGEIMPARAGGLQLVSLHDLRLGPRQAHALQGLTVKPWR